MRAISSSEYPYTTDTCWTPAEREVFWAANRLQIIAANNIFKSDAEDTVDVDYLPGNDEKVTDTLVTSAYTDIT